MTGYDDDRYGQMRVHIAEQRAALACEMYTRDQLREHAKARGLKLGARHKLAAAWYLAQQGMIDADGALRDRFPAVQGEIRCDQCGALPGDSAECRPAHHRYVNQQTGEQP